jgi:hypothetical protein
MKPCAVTYTTTWAVQLLAARPAGPQQPPRHGPGNLSPGIALGGAALGSRRTRLGCCNNPEPTQRLPAAFLGWQRGTFCTKTPLSPSPSSRSRGQIIIPVFVPIPALLDHSHQFIKWYEKRGIGWSMDFTFSRHKIIDMNRWQR